MGKYKSASSAMHTALNKLIHQNGYRRQNGEVASHGTFEKRKQVLHASFHKLRDIGFKIVVPQNLGNKHVQALCNYWQSERKAPGTIANNLSCLRTFCLWVNKKGMIGGLRHYLPDIPKKATSAIAEVSRSWAENGIDMVAKMREADCVDPKFGIMLSVELALGLRRHEVLCLKPHVADKGAYLKLIVTKGGRPRIVPIDTPEKRAVLDLAKASVKKSQYLGWQRKKNGDVATLQYSIGRYHRGMTKIGITKKLCGVTGHGLRAQFAENAMLALQLIPPTLGGTKGQMPKDELRLKREEISEVLGHCRPSITNSYVGSFGRYATVDDVNRTINTIASALPYCAEQYLPMERWDDCVFLSDEINEIGLRISEEQIHCLWSIHSQRHASEWVSLHGKNIAAIEQASLSLIKKAQ